MANARIKSLHIKHFRSFSDETIRLGDLTLLVGQNAAGKSNIVDAIRFIRDALIDGLDQAVSIRNGIRVVRQVSHGKRPFNVDIRIDYEVSPSADSRFENISPLQATYGFKLGSANDELRVVEESGDIIETSFLSLPDGAHEFVPTGLIRLERDKDGAISIAGEQVGRNIPFDELAHSRHWRLPHGSMMFPQTVSDVILRGARFASIYPNVMRTPAPSQATTTLTEDCRNWASVLRAMRKSPEGREDLKKVIALTKYVIPELEDVAVRSVGGFLIPHFRFSRGMGKRDMDLIPYQLSDGTLRLFGLLLALYQSPPATFLAIEEPEQMVHPGALHVLADAFNEAKQRTQLLVTTHSPYLLDLFDPSDIRVVSQGENGTRVGTVKSSQMKIIREGLMTLPEIMIMDGLEPQ